MPAWALFAGLSLGSTIYLVVKLFVSSDGSDSRRDGGGLDQGEVEIVEFRGPALQTNLQPRGGDPAAVMSPLLLQDSIDPVSADVMRRYRGLADELSELQV